MLKFLHIGDRRLTDFKQRNYAGCLAIVSQSESGRRGRYSIVAATLTMCCLSARVAGVLALGIELGWKTAFWAPTLVQIETRV